MYRKEEGHETLSRDYREEEEYSCGQDNPISGRKYWSKLVLVEGFQGYRFVSVTVNPEVVYSDPSGVKSDIVLSYFLFTFIPPSFLSDFIVRFFCSLYFSSHLSLPLFSFHSTLILDVLRNLYGSKRPLRTSVVFNK